MESSLGLANMESPTHTESQTSSSSAWRVILTMSSRVLAAVITPRLVRVKPNLQLVIGYTSRAAVLATSIPDKWAPAQVAHMSLWHASPAKKIRLSTGFLSSLRK